MVRPQQAGMKLLLRVRILAPAEIADQFGTVGHGLQRPQPHHAGKRCGIVPGPVHRAGLLFEHPPAPTSGAAPIKIVMEGGDIGMTLARIRQLVCLAETEAIEKPQRIAIPANHIELRTDLVVIELGEKPHEIVDHIAPRRERTQQIDLNRIEGDNLIR